MAKKRAGDGRDDLLDALYAAPPKAFVAERNRVVAALKQAGRSDEARAVAKRKRPTASVWAVNALARHAPEDVAELLRAGASLRADERKLLRGGGAEGFLEQARVARQKVALMTRRAEALLAEAEQKATATLARKISATLQAASIADEETRAALAAGRIDDDLVPPSSFGAAGADLSATLAASLAKKPANEKGAATPAGREAHERTHRGSAQATGRHARVGAADTGVAKEHGERTPARGRTHAAGERTHAAGERTHAAGERTHAAGERTHAAGERTHAAGERTHAAGERKRAAEARKRAAAERKRAAAAVREQRRAQAAARKRAATLARAATAAERVVAERARAVDKARAAVERAESELRAARDALADAETAAAAARRAADDAAD